MNIIIQIFSIFIFSHIVWTWIQAVRRGRRARQKLHQENTLKNQILINPAVSIIVPAWCEKGTIEPCIQSLKAINYPRWEALILAGGADGSIESVTQIVSGDHRFRVIERGSEPKNVAIMKGISNASYDVLVLLDADSLVDPDWLTELIAPLKRGSHASFGMHYPVKETWISKEEKMEIIQAYQILGTKMAQGCSSIAIYRDILAKICPLPPQAYAWEDWDIDVRLINGGYNISFAEGAKLRTDRPSTLKQFWFNSIRCQRSHLAGLWYHRLLFLRHPFWLLQELFFPIFSFLFFILTLASITIAVVFPSNTQYMLLFTFLVIFWVLGRRAALGLEISEYTSDYKWLKMAWAPAILLPVQIFASIIALVGVRKQPSFDYKGPRS